MLLLCGKQHLKVIWVWTPWGRVKDDKMFSFEWNIPVMCVQNYISHAFFLPSVSAKMSFIWWFNDMVFLLQRMEIFHGNAGSHAEFWLILHCTIPVSHDQVRQLFNQLFMFSSETNLFSWWDHLRRSDETGLFFVVVRNFLIALQMNPCLF